MNLLQWHLEELQGLYKRMDEGEAKTRIAARIEECKREIIADKALTEDREESTL